jgi:hypothetical protein
MPVSRLRQIAGAAREVPAALSLIRRHGRPSAVFYFGESPGDDLLATAVLRRWHQVRGRRAAYLTQHPQLFERNADVAFTAPYNPALAGAFQLLGVVRTRLVYHAYDPATDRSLAPRGTHIIDLMCRTAGLLPLPDPHPTLTLAPEEIVRSQKTRIVVQSSALSARMPIVNKEWFPDRMQAVVDALRRDAEVVQLGSPSDPALNGVLDLRGRTTLREAAGVMAGAQLFVGMVGFLMHLAAAVGTRSVVVFGGREQPSESGYAENRNLFTELPCSPCWLWNTCPYEHECMRRIGADDVIREARGVLAGSI